MRHCPLNTTLLNATWAPPGAAGCAAMCDVAVFGVLFNARREAGAQKVTLTRVDGLGPLS